MNDETLKKQIDDSILDSIHKDRKLYQEFCKYQEYCCDNHELANIQFCELNKEFFLNEISVHVAIRTRRKQLYEEKNKKYWESVAKLIEFEESHVCEGIYLEYCNEWKKDYEMIRDNEDILDEIGWWEN